MENLRKNLLLFCYQLGYLRKGKERLNISLNTLRPALTQYNHLAKDIRDKTKERRSLLSEKRRSLLFMCSGTGNWRQRLRL